MDTRHVLPACAAKQKLAAACGTSAGGTPSAATAARHRRPHVVRCEQRVPSPRLHLCKQLRKRAEEQGRGRVPAMCEVRASVASVCV
jgi:hypothetical protein